ncbi:hypothetical protein, partial [Vibrio harveyi]|uniref:hypothetical protein n=1 Tax=Vibrio harveyi TaxID=669 RepID=UPI000A618363
SKEITITVEKAAGNTITVSDIAMTYGDADVAINASGGNPGASFEYQSLNSDVVSPATDTHKEVVTEFFVTVADAAFATSTVVRRELKSADYVVGKLVDITFKEDIDQDSVSISNDNAAILSVSSRVVRVKLLKAGTVVLYVRVNSINYHLLIYIGLR